MRVSAESIQWRLGIVAPFVGVLALVYGSDVVAQTPKGKTDARCRVYATEAVATSSGGPSTVVTTYRGTHDAGTHTTTYKVTYTDSAGPKFAYVQTTVYPSTAAFLDEVRVLAPLTRSTSTTATGGMAFALTNEYDAQQRLTRIVNKTGGATITTTYTSWDGNGRPTAGAISPGGAIKITYDDAARVALTTRSFGTESQSYDVDGNPLQAIQRYGGREVTTITKLVSSAEVCEPTK